MLEVTQLSRRYGDFLAVDRVSFTINHGEIVGLLGHNGAGKTTIMKMLSGFLEPHSGDVQVDGRDLASDAGAIQAELGYLPENLPVYPDMVVADYLDFAAELKGLRGPRKRAELRRVVAATEIGDKLLAPIATLSRGFKQRVGVAQAILARPKLLILDEPTNGLDPTQTDHMRQLIRDLAAEATVILSTHIMQEVEALCDRVLILRAGSLAVDARLDELRRSETLLLETSLEDAATGSTCNSLEGVVGVQPGREPGSFMVSLEAGVDVRTVGAALARAVHQADAQLYRLEPVRRDLETLFREVSSSSSGPAGSAREARHAA